MNRLHVHLHVRDISESVRFYTALFGAEPARRENDYAKWMLDDPRVNFAISARDGEIGFGHLGIQVESADALAEMTARAKNAAGTVLVERGANCCYAVSDRAWVEDPQGVRWEAFHTKDKLAIYGEGAEESHIEAVKPVSSAACCC